MTELVANEGLLPTSLEQVHQIMAVKDDEIAMLKQQVDILKQRLGH